MAESATLTFSEQPRGLLPPLKEFIVHLLNGNYENYPELEKLVGFVEGLENDIKPLVKKQLLMLVAAFGISHSDEFYKEDNYTTVGIFEVDIPSKNGEIKLRFQLGANELVLENLDNNGKTTTEVIETSATGKVENICDYFDISVADWGRINGDGKTHIDLALILAKKLAEYGVELNVLGINFELEGKNTESEPKNTFIKEFVGNIPETVAEVFLLYLNLLMGVYTGRNNFGLAELPEFIVEIVNLKTMLVAITGTALLSGLKSFRNSRSKN